MQNLFLPFFGVGDGDIKTVFLNRIHTMTCHPTVLLFALLKFLDALLAEFWAQRPIKDFNEMTQNALLSLIKHGIMKIGSRSFKFYDGCQAALTNLK